MPEPRTKKCSRCKWEMPFRDFNIDQSTKSGLSCYCRECARKRKKEYCDKNGDKVIQYNKKYRASPRGRQKDRDNALKYTYGITREQHKQKYINQNGCCALCRGSVPYDKITTDHNHDTGKVRGLLCPRCNTGLGQFRDDEKLLSLAINYIRSF